MEKNYNLEARKTIKVSNSLDPDQDVLLVMLWVQTVCKGYQQKTKVTASKERINNCQQFVT